MGITARAVVTLYPDTLEVTNVWEFVNDFDLDAVSVGPSDAEEPEFSLSVRADKKVRACAHAHPPASPPLYFGC